MVFAVPIALLLTAAVPGRYPQGSTGPLTEARLAAVPAGDWQLLINEVYARHGYPFRDSAVRAYFAGQAWYRPAATPSPLTAVEEQNVQLVHRLQHQGYSGFGPFLEQVAAAVRRQDAQALRAVLLPGAGLVPSWPTRTELPQFEQSLRRFRNGPAAAPENWEGRLCTVFSVTLYPVQPSGEGGGGYVYYFSKVFSAAHPAGRWYLVYSMAAG